MSRYASAATTLSAAIGIALGVAACAGNTPQQMKKDMGNMPQTAKENMDDKLQKCYGINAASKNDCAAGAHSCAGHATIARDPQSFVLLPAGACNKIDGGKPKPS